MMRSRDGQLYAGRLARCGAEGLASPPLLIEPRRLWGAAGLLHRLTSAWVPNRLVRQTPTLGLLWR
jgi:hypothetical protein